MKKVLLIGAFVGCAVGASLGACSSSTTPGGTAGSTSTATTMTTSSGSPTSSSSSSGGGAPATTSSSSSSSSGMGGATTTSSSSGSCQSDPTLHAATAGSIYCGFGADGGSETCAIGQECCIGGSVDGGFDPDQCNTWGTACPNPVGGGLAVVCEQPSDCTANGWDGGAAPLCCLMGSTPAQVAGCDAADLKAKNGSGTQCISGTSCGTGNTQLCLQDSDCPSGKTCKAFRWKIIEMGACM